MCSGTVRVPAEVVIVLLKRLSARDQTPPRSVKVAAGGGAWLRLLRFLLFTLGFLTEMTYGGRGDYVEVTC